MEQEPLKLMVVTENIEVSIMIYILESNLFNEVSHQYLQLTHDAK